MLCLSLIYKKKCNIINYRILYINKFNVLQNTNCLYFKNNIPTATIQTIHEN